MYASICLCIYIYIFILFLSFPLRPSLCSMYLFSLQMSPNFLGFLINLFHIFLNFTKSFIIPYIFKTNPNSWLTSETHLGQTLATRVQCYKHFYGSNISFSIVILYGLPIVTCRLPYQFIKLGRVRV